jgi:hypothetical protein
MDMRLHIMYLPNYLPTYSEIVNMNHFFVLHVHTHLPAH